MYIADERNVLGERVPAETKASSGKRDSADDRAPANDRASAEKIAPPQESPLPGEKADAEEIATAEKRASVVTEAPPEDRAPSGQRNSSEEISPAELFHWPYGVTNMVAQMCYTGWILFLVLLFGYPFALGGLLACVLGCIMLRYGTHR